MKLRRLPDGTYLSVEEFLDHWLVVRLDEYYDVLSQRKFPDREAAVRYARELKAKLEGRK